MPCFAHLTHNASVVLCVLLAQKHIGRQVNLPLTTQNSSRSQFQPRVSLLFSDADLSAMAKAQLAGKMQLQGGVQVTTKHGEEEENTLIK